MITKYVFLLSLIVYLGSCSSSLRKSQDVIKASNTVSGNVYQIITKDGENTLFCPISFHLLLTLVTLGAGGQTETELRSGLQLGYNNCQIKKAYEDLLDEIEGTTELKLATRLFPNNNVTLVKNFVKVAQNYFDSDVQTIDYSYPVTAAKTINSFVEAKTNNKIKDLISSDSLGADTALVLVNAAYFNATWLYPFKYTYKGDFYVNKDSPVETDLMTITKTFKYSEVASLDAKVLQIPFKNKAYSMLFILPNAIDGIKGLEYKLKGVNIGDIAKQINSTYVVRVTIPEFKIETTLNLNNVMAQLGIQTVLTNGADLSGIVQPPPSVFVSKAVQKTYINVNKDGVEAAAATAVVISVTSIMQEQKVFDGNKPFVFAILYNNLVLFVGKLAKV